MDDTIRVVKYEVTCNTLQVGFNVRHFVVYAEVYNDPDKTKEQLIQQAFEQCKQSIDYEKTQEFPSLPWIDEDGDEFIPGDPLPTSLVVNFNNLSGTVLDQYRDIYSTDIEFYIEGTDKAVIESNTVIEYEVEEDTEYIIVAKFEGLTKEQKRIIYARNTIELDSIRKQLLEVQQYIVDEEAGNLLNEGRDVNVI